MNLDEAKLFIGKEVKYFDIFQSKIEDVRQLEDGMIIAYLENKARLNIEVLTLEEKKEEGGDSK